ANAAVAEWVTEMVLTLAAVDQAAGMRLQELALAGEAAEGKMQVIPVFKWEHSPQTKSVKANDTICTHDPIEAVLPTCESALFSLSLTVSVETYPGRPLPVIHIEHRKAVWAREPANKYERLSGFALP
nr:hypothetical protein [Tanacetum cinerariifolium]